MTKLMRNPIFMDEYEVIRQALVRTRANAGVSQHALAERIGRSPSHIALIETGQRKLELLETFYIFEALGVDPAIVVGGLFKQFTRARQESQPSATAA